MEIIKEHALALQTMILLLCCSSFFSGSETALFSLSKHQIFHLLKDNRRSSRLITRLLSKPTELLTTILVGNLAVNVLFFCISTVIMSDIGRTYGNFYGSLCGLASLILVIFFAEIFPKACGITFPLAISRISCFPVFIWEIISFPLNFFFLLIIRKLEYKKHKSSRISEEEFKMLLSKSRESGSLNTHCGEIIEEIMELSSLKVKHIMVPRTDLVICDPNDSVENVMRMARKHRFYFILAGIRKKNLDIKGIVDIKELCLCSSTTEKVSKHVKPIKFVPETKKAGELMDEMIKEQLFVVAAVDEYGGISGIVTLNDIFREIVGRIENDQNQELPEVEEIGSNIYRVSGLLSTGNWKDFFSGELELEEQRALEITTIGGFITYLLDRIPREGDTVFFHNLCFTVEKMGLHRIESIIMKIYEEKI